MGERTELIRFALRFCQHGGYSWSLTTDEKPVFHHSIREFVLPAAPPRHSTRIFTLEEIMKDCLEKGCLPCVEEEEEEPHDGNLRFGWILERCRKVVLKIYKYSEKQKYWSSEKKCWRWFG